MKVTIPLSLALLVLVPITLALIALWFELQRARRASARYKHDRDEAWRFISRQAADLISLREQLERKVGQ